MASVVLALVAVVFVARNSSSLDWLVVRVAGLAVLLLVGGGILGSERLAAASTIPMVVGVTLSAVGQERLVWTESLVVGCIWFVAVEAALASIEYRGPMTPDPAVVTRRVVEVASVIVLSTAVGLLAVGIAAFAPERSLLLRVGVASLVLAVLFSSARRLSD